MHKLRLSVDDEENINCVVKRNKNQGYLQKREGRNGFKWFYFSHFFMATGSLSAQGVTTCGDHRTGSDLILGS